MTIVDELGYIFIAFGPALAMFFITVAPNPHEVIVMILGYEILVCYNWNINN